MARQRIVGRDRLFHEIGAFRTDAWIDVLAVITPGPAVKAALLHGCHIIGNQVRAELVTFVHHGPKSARLGMEVEPIGIANTRGKNFCCTRLAIDLPDCGTSLLRLDPPLTRIGVGSDRGVEKASVGAESEILRPMVVDRPARERRKDPGLRCDGATTKFVGIGKNRIGSSDIECVLKPGDTERRIQAGQKVDPLVNRAVPICVAQKGNAVGFATTTRITCGHGHDPAADDVLRSFERLAGGRLRLDHEDVAIRKRMNGARIR